MRPSDPPTPTGYGVIYTVKELGIDIGGTTEDRHFSLEIGRCFGACGLAPAMSIGDEVFKRVRPARIPEILTRYNEVDAEKEGVVNVAG